MLSNLTQQNKSAPNAPRVWLRVDKAHVAKIIKARRALCIGEEVRR